MFIIRASVVMLASSSVPTLKKFNPAQVTGVAA